MRTLSDLLGRTRTQLDDNELELHSNMIDCVLALEGLYARSHDFLSWFDKRVRGRLAMARLRRTLEHSSV